MTGNDFVRLIKTYWCLISKRVVQIKISEKANPIKTASKIPAGETLKYGMTNISAPVLIIIGGIMIFLTVAGSFDAFIRIRITPTPKISVIIIDKINDTLLPPNRHIYLPHYKLF